MTHTSSTSGLPGGPVVGVLVGHELELLEFLFGVPDRVQGVDVLAAGADPQVEYAVNANLLAVAAGSAPPYVSARQIWRNTVATVGLDHSGRFSLSGDGASHV